MKTDVKMKGVTKIFMAALLTGMCSLGCAQPDWQKLPKPTEEYKGIITDKVAAGYVNYAKGYLIFENGSKCDDHRETISDYQLYLGLLSKARREYGDYDLELRNFNSSTIEERTENIREDVDQCHKFYQISAFVVKPAPTLEHKPISTEIDPLTKALNKALQDIREGSRLALDIVRVADGDKEDFKDQIVEILLDEGYKVVAKDYLEKLYEEQKAQQSGIYNERTTVQENNFSAVGYYINVKETETAIKVQVINVSTGEYESNITVNL